VATVQKMSLYEYTARVLARLCHAALVSARQGEGKLANYRQLPAALWPELSNYWNVHFSEAEMQRMLLAAQMDAKNPVLPFEPDSQTKRNSVSGELRELTHHWLGEVYQSLELQRRASGLRD